MEERTERHRDGVSKGGTEGKRETERGMKEG